MSSFAPLAAKFRGPFYIVEGTSGDGEALYTIEDTYNETLLTTRFEAVAQAVLFELEKLPVGS